MTRILVIEDNDDVAFGLRNNLEIEGYQVEVASDGSAGLARAIETRPDLIVLDLCSLVWTGTASCAFCVMII